MLTSGRTGLLASVLALGLVAACGDGTGPQGVTGAELPGDYTARTFSTDSAGVTVDHLTQGAVLAITLRSDGSTTGRLIVPGGGANGANLDADLAGTFSFDESTGRVSFDELADTFVRDLSFTAARGGYRGTQLEGRQSFGGTVIHVVLSQYNPVVAHAAGSP